MTQEQLITGMLEAPERIIGQWDLEYVNNEQLTICRCRHGKGFVYKKSGRPLRSPKDLRRFRELIIPPAWSEVRISELENGHLQAVGIDDKNRKQYLYHPKWTQIANGTKFAKMVAFGKHLPAIRKKVEKDLRTKGWGQAKVTALVIKLMEETHIRIGGRQYAQSNSTYGLSTMRKKHVYHEGGKIWFQFVGKKGKEHQVTLRNKKLVALVNRCEEIPGWELFKYFDVSGQKKVLKSGMVNEYLHQICGEYFTAKDFRTWAASVIFFDTVRMLGIATNEKEIKSNILKGIDSAANALGNTRAVCRKYYIHPSLVEAYTQTTILPYFKMAGRNKGTSYFSPSEGAMLRLLKKQDGPLPVFSN